METQIVKLLNSSVALLQEGQSFRVDEFVLGTIDSATVFVNCYSAYKNLDSFTKAIAVDELNAAAKKFYEISGEAREFREFAKSKSIQYILVMDTGSAGVNICSLTEGIVAYLL